MENPYKGMQVVILCGGMGTRLREETEFKPKPIVEIGHKPIVWHIMKIYSYYGFKEFVLCLGYKGELIKEYFLNFEIMNSDFSIQYGSNSRDLQVHNHRSIEDWKVTLVDTGLNAMTGARLRKIKPYIKTDNFMLTYGDGVADLNVKKLVDFHLSHGKITTVTGVKPIARFGVLASDGDRVTEFEEKPQTKEGYINGGFFVLNQKVFDYLDDDEGCVFERAPMDRLVGEGQLMIYHHDGYWHCMDTIRDMSMLEAEWSKEKPAWKIWD